MNHTSFTDIHNSDQWTISILVRDVNGKRRSIVYASREDLVNNLTDGWFSNINSEDEVLLVMWGEIMLYNALAVNHDSIITMDDVVGFFG